MVSTDPNSYRLRMLMGDAFFARERYEEATKEYQAALNLQPTNSDLHLRNGQGLSQAGEVRRTPRAFQTIGGVRSP